MTKRIGILTLINDNSLVILNASDQGLMATKLRKELKFSDTYRQANVSGDLSNAVPKPEDFLPFQFRHISATIIGGGTWKATDFSNEKVIKKIPQLLSYQPVYLNHNMDVTNVVGTNGQLIFSPAKKVNGTLIPAGVDGPIWIDGKLHTDLCRQLASYPVPQIQSVSVTIVFEWEPSHEFKDQSGNQDDWEFERQIGRLVEGKMVRRIAVDAVAAYETSLVWNGADPFAKMLDEKGNPINIDRSNIVGADQFDQDPLTGIYKKDNRFFIASNVFSDEKTVNLYRQEIINYSKTENPLFVNPKNEEPMNELQKFLATVMGVAEEAVTVDLLKQHTFTKTPEFTTMKANADLLQATKDKVTAAEANVAKLSALIPLDKVETISAELKKIGENTTIEAILPFAIVGKESLEHKRTTCVKAYKLAVGEKNEDAAVLATIQGADSKLLDGMLKQYGKKIGEEFTGVCLDCKSTNVSFRSTTAETTEDSNSGNVEFNMPLAFRQ